MIVGVHFDNDRHFVRRVTFEDHVLHGGFIASGAGAFRDRAFNYVARHAGFARFLNRSKEARVTGRIAAAELGGDGHFFDELADHLTLFEVHDGAFRVEPLTSHAREIGKRPRAGKRRVGQSVIAVSVVAEPAHQEYDNREDRDQDHETEPGVGLAA